MKVHYRMPDPKELLTNKRKDFSVLFWHSAALLPSLCDSRAKTCRKPPMKKLFFKSFGGCETTIKIKFALLRAVGCGGREENCPKSLFSLGNARDRSVGMLAESLSIQIKESPFGFQ